MTVDLENMRHRCWKALGFEDNDPDLSVDDIDIALNESYWELQDKFPFRETEKTVRFDTIAGTRSYDMPKPYQALISLAIKDANSGEFSNLERMSTDEYENRFDEDESAQGPPTHYTRENCFVRLWPTPDEAYTLSMKRLITLEDLSNLNNVPEIPRAWWEIIRFGGIWRLFIDYGDFARSNQIKGHQVSLISSMVPTASKEEKDSRWAGVEVHKPEYNL